MYYLLSPFLSHQNILFNFNILTHGSPSGYHSWHYLPFRMFSLFTRLFLYHIACRNCSCIVTIGLIHTKCELIFAVPWTNTTKIFASMQERILCRICFEREICIVLLPCRHHVLCELVWMFISIYPHILIIYITINLWEFWSSPLVSLAGLALTSASHVQFADWPLRAGYLFMMQCCQPIHMWRSLEVPMLPAVLGYQLLVSAKMAHKIPIRGRQVVKFLVWSLEESENKSPIVRLEYKKNKKPHCTFFCSDMTQRKQGSIWGLRFLDSCSHIV